MLEDQLDLKGTLSLQIKGVKSLREEVWRYHGHSLLSDFFLVLLVSRLLSASERDVLTGGALTIMFLVPQLFWFPRGASHAMLFSPTDEIHSFTLNFLW